MSGAPWRWSAVEMARALRSGTISSEELVDACLAPADAVEPTINALTERSPEEAHAAAPAADADVRRR
jgi:amidase